MNKRDMREEAARQEYQRRYAEFKERGHSFWPHSIIQDVLAAAFVFGGLLLLTTVWGVPLDAPADPTNSSYIPRPEWYFMFLFELLKVFPGYLEWVGVVVVPSVLVLALLLLPFYDRKSKRRPTTRPAAMVLGTLAVVAIVFLTVQAYKGTPSGGGELTDAQLLGKQLVEDQCLACHSVRGKGGSLAPPLDGLINTYDTATLHIYVEDPKKVNPNSTMPAYIPASGPALLTHQEVEQIVDYLSTLK